MTTIARRAPHVDRSAFDAHQLDVLLQHVNQLGGWTRTQQIADAVDLRQAEAHTLLTTLAMHGHIEARRTHLVGSEQAVRLLPVDPRELINHPPGQLCWLGIAVARKAA